MDQAEQGDEMPIGQAGKPEETLVPCPESHSPRTPGGWEGRVWIAPDFDDLPPEIVPAFVGERL